MIAIIVIFCLAGLAWGTFYALRGSVLLGCLVYMVTACCFGPFFFSAEVGLSVTIDRAVFVALVGVAIVQWRLRLMEPKPLIAADYILLAFIAWLGISTFTHDYTQTGPDETPIVQHLINGYLMPLALYFIARQSVHNEKAFTRVLVGFAIFGFYLAVTGVAEVSQQWWLVFPKYISNPEIGLHFSRARGPMLQSVSYGVYLSTCLFCLWLLRTRLQGLWWWVAAGVTPLFLASVYLSKTRSVWVGTACGLMVILCVTLKGRVRMAVIGGMILCGVLAGVSKFDAILGLQREGTVQNTRKSVSMRGSFAYVSWKMFQEKPLLGYGFGQFAREKLPFLSDRSTDMHLEAIRPYVHHSTFLAVLTETGLIGLVLFLALLAAWVHASVRIVRHERAPPWVAHQGLLMLAILAMAFFQMVGHEITFTPLDNSVIYFFAGAVIGLRAKELAANQRLLQPDMNHAVASQI